MLAARECGAIEQQTSTRKGRHILWIATRRRDEKMRLRSSLIDVEETNQRFHTTPSATSIRAIARVLFTSTLRGRRRVFFARRGRVSPERRWAQFDGDRRTFHVRRERQSRFLNVFSEKRPYRFRCCLHERGGWHAHPIHPYVRGSGEHRHELLSAHDVGLVILPGVRWSHFHGIDISALQLKKGITQHTQLHLVCIRSFPSRPLVTDENYGRTGWELGVRREFASTAENMIRRELLFWIRVDHEQFRYFNKVHGEMRRMYPLKDFF